ncbi:MAG: biopolymer transporter ExbD [Planctomycetaceae bacterium]|nr:biopolymer transporter ExbD [Planctomycetaceae bacterium]
MKIKSQPSTVPEVDMTPMIDIVFQLIAFFMVISNFEQDKADERVSLPKDQLAKPPVSKRESAFTLNFGFDRDVQGNIVDQTAYIFDGDQKFTIDTVRNRLRQEARFYEAIGKEKSDVTVEIRADKDVKSGEVQELIQMCQEDDIQFERFALKATQKVDGF